MKFKTVKSNITYIFLEFKYFNSFRPQRNSSIAIYETCWFYVIEPGSKNKNLVNRCNQTKFLFVNFKFTICTVK